MTAALGFAGGVQLAVQHDYERAALDLLDSVQQLRDQGDEFGELHVWVGPGLAHLSHTGRSAEALGQLDSLQPRIDSLANPLLKAHAAYRRSSALVNIDPESAIDASHAALDAAETAGTTWTVGAVRNQLGQARS